MSGISENYYKAFEEIISIKDQNIHDKNEYNRQSLDILLKYDIVDVDSARDLIESGKMPIDNAEGILDKYE